MGSSSQSIGTLERDSSVAPFEPPTGSMDNLVNLEREVGNPPLEGSLSSLPGCLPISNNAEEVYLRVPSIDEDIGDALIALTSSGEPPICAS